MTHPALPAADAAFATALAESPRGPDRDGVFALWLVVRAALGGSQDVHPARHGERLKALAARLKSLSTPTPLRRALAGAAADLQDGGAGSAVALAQLVAPTAETLGRKLADAVATAARAAQAQQPQARPA